MIVVLKKILSNNSYLIHVIKLTSNIQKLTFPKPKKMWFFLVYVYIACEALQNDKSMHACDLTGINTSYQELDN